MAKKCQKCGKTLGILEGEMYSTINGDIRVCPECLKKIEKMEKREEEKREIEENKKKSETFKQEMTRSNLAIPESQLQELIHMKEDISWIKSDIHTISTIVLIWFILGLITALISVITFLSII